MRRSRLFRTEGGAIAAHLRRMFRRAGRGSMLRVTQALGLRETYFSEWSTRPPAVLDGGLVVAALKVLGIRPGAFYDELDSARRRRKPTAELWEGPEPVEERATPATRRAVAIAAGRMRAELGLDVDAGDGDGGADEPPVEESDPGPSLGVEWLEDLDGRRQTEPEAVIAELAAGLHRVEPQLLPRALGTWGSALWMLIELEAAAYVNRRALRLARALGDHATVADLLQRRAHVMGDGGDYCRALALAEQAGGIFDRIGDRAGRGRAAVDQGQWLYYLDWPREAIAAQERALELLPESLPRNRFAALSILSLCCLQLREPGRARDFAEDAEKLPVVAFDRGKLCWLRADICRQLGDRSEALEHLRRGAEAFRTLHLGDYLLISLELVQTLLEDGRPGEAFEVCSTLHGLLPPLENNPIIGGALMELLRVSVTGRAEKLSLGLVRRVRAKIEHERDRKSARARRAWRALAVGP